MQTIDVSAKICELFPRDYATEWPMYSYSRPAIILWNSIANGLHKRGWSEAEIKDWLQSKHPRWSLDGDLGDALEKLGAKYAKQCEKLEA